MSIQLRNATNVIVPFYGASSRQSVGAPAPPLMPEPASAVSSDPMAMLYALTSKQRSADMEQGQADVAHNREMEKAQMVQQQEALQKQEDAEQQAAQWGIFGKIASVIAIAVSAVAAACSCGAASALCVAACVLSTVAFAEGQAQVLTKLTGNPDVDKAFQIGAGIAAAICSGGAGIANLGVSVVKTVAGSFEIAGAACTIGKDALSASSDKTCQDVSVGLGIGGAACSLGGGIAGATDGVSDVADAAGAAVAAGANVAKGAAEVGEGISTIVSSQYEADATDRMADAKQAELAIKHIQQLTELMIDGIKDLDGSHKRALQTLQGAMQTQGQTLIIASARV